MNQPEIQAHPNSNGLNALLRPILLWALPFGFLAFGLPVVGKIMGANALEVGGLFSIFTATTLVLRPVVGWAIDRWGRKRFLTLSLLLYAAAMLIFALTDSLADLYLARLIQGIGSAFFWITINTMVADLTTHLDRGQAQGRVAQTSARGNMFGVFIGFTLMLIFSQSVGWKASFLVYSAADVLAAWLIWRGTPETKSIKTDTPKAFGPPPFNLEWMKIKGLLSTGLTRLMVVTFATGLTQGMLSPIYLFFLQDRFGDDLSKVAWAFLPALVVQSLLSARLGGLSDRFGRAQMMALGMAGSGLLTILLPGLPSLLWLGATYTLSAVTWAISEPAEAALVAELTGGEHTGTAYGLYDFVTNLGFATGPLLGGLFYDQLSQAAPFYLNGTVMILSAGWVLLALRQPHHTSARGTA